MALTKAQLRAQIEALFSDHEEKVAEAFRQAIDSINSRIVLERVIRFLEAGEVQRAVDELGIDKGDFSPFVAAILDAYRAGGSAVMPQIGSRVAFDAFGSGETEARDYAFILVETAVSAALTTASVIFMNGVASQVAADTLVHQVVGIQSRVTKKPMGGLLWLSTPLQEWVSGAREELRSGDPALMREYLKRGLRDKLRFDKTIREAMRTGKRLPDSFISRAIRSYAQNLVVFRIGAFGEAGAIGAINMGRDHGASQAYAKAGIANPDRPFWVSQRDFRVRNTHVYLDGQQRHADGLFHSSSGAVLRFPRDPQAPLKETANCRCYMQYGPIPKRPPAFEAERALLGEYYGWNSAQ